MTSADVRKAPCGGDMQLPAALPGINFANSA
jgi:hypothetical protein